ncbi:ADAMTS9 [Cordylochernes scorpioides]|uniref:ADAMTS9 n=1 Tax=Cordylochernes scorpioides TaxID=51811 RepID=A0ABY6KAE4_9ARAC|nr:ADAMTS9 [Cordylochernes scorpioides]
MISVSLNYSKNCHGHGHCLLDRPEEDLLAGVSGWPGETYDMDQQCELVFANDSKICPYMPACRRLWCTMGDDGGCRTQHMPWADGTPCETDKTCHHGECLSLKKASGVPVDGQWGTWKAYGECSRSCGGGVQKSERECDNPRPTKGGKYCVGERVRYQSCNARLLNNLSNAQPCPRGSEDFRDEQCSVFDGKHFNFSGLTENVTWVSHYANVPEGEECRLYCRAKGTAAFFMLKERVVDGTPCGPDTFNICVNGICMNAGCDHALGSKKQADICGVCGGDNSTCRVITGSFHHIEYGTSTVFYTNFSSINSQRPPEICCPGLTVSCYNTVVLLPEGAGNLDIRQHGRQDDNYLARQHVVFVTALKDPDTNEYLLNGDFMITKFPKRLRYAGLTLDYTGSGADVERVNSSRHELAQPLLVQVLAVGALSDPDVHFQYTVPISARRYLWDLEPDWTPCSHRCQGNTSRCSLCYHLYEHLLPVMTPHVDELVTWQSCGAGEQYRRPMCLHQQSGEMVEETLCPDPAPPKLAQTCNLECELQWHVVQVSACSTSCGPGVRSRVTRCRGLYPTTTVDLPDEECRHLPRPPATEACVGPCSQAHWKYGPWSPCSASCGKGRQTRIASCAGSRCADDLKLVHRACEGSACPSWRAGNWSQCSATCGSGLRRRTVSCQLEGRAISVSHCRGLAALPDKEICHRLACVTWKPSPWGPCSVSCGQGLRHRTLACQGPDGAPVKAEECSAIKKPPTRESCREARCPHLFPLVEGPPPYVALPSAPGWDTGAWSPCSATCGRGVRRRRVVCINLHDGAPLIESACDSAQQPEFLEICEEAPCGTWRIGPWSACSVTCGEGIMSRNITCVLASGRPGIDHECDRLQRPASEQRCVPPGCTQGTNRDLHYWRVGHWGPCSRTCGPGGMQRRQVACYHRDGHAAPAGCAGLERPNESTPCQPQPECPAWVTRDWGACLPSCHSGNKTRTVACLSDQHDLLPDAHCDIRMRPPDVAVCHEATDCQRGSTQWEADPWTQCSVTCGRGLERRNVRCLGSDGKTVNPYKCEGPPPAAERDCSKPPCPRWGWAPWSPCSATCGNGTQSRSPRCLFASRCPGPSPAPETRPCAAMQPCFFRWRKKRWSTVKGERSRADVTSLGAQA